MNLLKASLISWSAPAEPAMPEEEIRSALAYIMSGRDYTARVSKSLLLGFTFLPPYNGPWQPRPMNTLDRFLAGDWRRCSWEKYVQEELIPIHAIDKNPGSRRLVLKRRLLLAFLSAVIADIALSFIIWLLIVMGFSFFGLGDLIGSQINPLGLLIGSAAVLFLLLFWGFFAFIKPQKNKL
jgi:hypothetical protein